MFILDLPLHLIPKKEEKKSPKSQNAHVLVFGVEVFKPAVLCLNHTSDLQRDVGACVVTGVFIG